MPILKPEPDLFPDDLFELDRREFPWWVAHLRSRQEKLAAREALARGVPFYLPQREQVTRTPSRRRVSYLPLFTGYLFFRGTVETHRLEILKTNLCVRILEVHDQESIHHDLRQVLELQRRGLPLLPFEDQLAVGDDVKITDGPFKGFDGQIVKEKSGLRLVVSVRFIHRAVAVELPREVLVPAAPRPAP